MAADILFLYVVVLTIASTFVAIYAVPVMNRRTQAQLRSAKITSSGSQHQVGSGETQIERYDHFFDHENLSRAIAKLELGISYLKPDFLIGVNSGGMHLAKYYQARIGLESHQVIEIILDKSDIRYLRNDHLDLRVPEGLPSPDFNNSRIVFVDDFVKTGRTLQIIKDSIRKSYGECPNVKFAALSVVINYLDDVDCIGAAVTNPNVVFPWSSDERIKKARDREQKYHELKKVNIFDKKFESIVDSEIGKILKPDGIETSTL